MKIAVITGASSGLGREYFDAVVESYPELDQIWIIARRLDRLNAMADGNPKVKPLSLDLTKNEDLEKYRDELVEADADVKILINNAGFGKLGNMYDMPTDSQVAMIDLNVRALTAMTSMTLPHMKRGAFIINVCSIAAFAPNPRMTVYCSTKAYVLSFSKSLSFELRDKGINVLAVCPGPMDTEFLGVAGIPKGASKTFDTLPRCNPRTVARKSLERAAKGKKFYTNKAFYKFYRVMAKLLPHNLVMHMSKT